MLNEPTMTKLKTLRLDAMRGRKLRPHHAGLGERERRAARSDPQQG